jgi:hypothetical protein
MEPIGSRQGGPLRTIPGKGAVGAAAGIGIVIDVTYLWLILGEGDGGLDRAVFVATFIAASVTAALVAGSVAGISVRTRLVLIGAATGGFLSIGVLAILSIGFPLLVAGALCALGWGRFARSVRVPTGVPLGSALAMVGAAAVLSAGIAAT